LAAEHKPREALAELQTAIDMRPKQSDARRQKAWLLATYLDPAHPNENVRDGKEAVRLAKEALDLSRWQSAEYWDTLAAAQAEMGNFKEAVEAEEKAIEAAERIHADDILPELKKRLEMFKGGVRYHAEPGMPMRW
jgi:tetratricopeptide (TPR) repeat protein